MILNRFDSLEIFTIALTLRGGIMGSTSFQTRDRSGTDMAFSLSKLAKRNPPSSGSLASDLQWLSLEITKNEIDKEKM